MSEEDEAIEVWVSYECSAQRYICSDGNLWDKAFVHREMERRPGSFVILDEDPQSPWVLRQRIDELEERLELLEGMGA